MNDNSIRIPEKAVPAVKNFIGTYRYRLKWWRANSNSLWSVVGSKNGVALVGAFLAGYLCGKHTENE